MFYKAPNQYITEGNPFEIDGVLYPANWINLSTAQEKTAIELVEVTDANTPEDDKFYWVSSTLNGAIRTYTNTPKDLNALKEHWTVVINNTAYNLLQSSDWMVVKAQETQTPMSDAWKTYRAAVRTTANSSRAAIAAAADVPALQQAVLVTWPHDPNYIDG
jgi:hypothetical protein